MKYYIEKKHFTRVFLTTLILGTLLIGMMGCKNTSTPTSADGKEEIETTNTNKQVVLNYYTWSDATSVDSKVVEAFNKLNPNIQVKLKSIENDYYGDTMKILLSEATNDIDLFSIRTPGETNRYAASGALTEITNYLRESSLNLAKYGPLIDHVATNNRYYALPKSSSGWYLFYNKDIFDKEGLPYPKQMTWEEYADLANHLTKGTGKNKQWGGYWAPWILNFMAIQSGEYLIDDDLSATKKALLFYNRIYNEDKSHMNISDMATSSNCMTEFESGKIAMFPQGDWFIFMFEVDKKAGKTDVNWDMAPMPIFDGMQPGKTVGGFSTMAISNTCKHKKEAFKFLEYFCGEKGAIIYAKNATIPGYSAEEATREYIKTTGKESTRIMFEAKLIQEQAAHPQYSSIHETFIKDATQYLDGNYSLNEMMNQFIKKRKEILQNNVLKNLSNNGTIRHQLSKEAQYYDNINQSIYI